jgi:dTDP-glucose 4,6-dehydratase
VKIFITGGAGFIGSNFIRHVLSPGDSYTVVNFDKQTYPGNLANLQDELFLLPITDSFVRLSA